MTSHCHQLVTTPAGQDRARQDRTGQVACVIVETEPQTAHLITVLHKTWIHSVLIGVHVVCVDDGFTGEERL